LFDGLGSPLALAAKKLVVESKWDELLELSNDPRSYSTAISYYLDTQAIGFLKKYADLPNSADRKAAAVKKWWDGERECYLSNERLSPYLPQHAQAPVDERVGGIDELFSLTRKIILEWIGPRPPSLAAGRFGPGATFSDPSRKATAPEKMSSDPSLTRDAVWYLPQWLGTQWGSAFAARHGELSFVRGNRFGTAPKTSKTHRATGVEPSINVFYQLFYGRVLTDRLLKAGWDKRLMKEVHAEIARHSSITREFATLDLANASDTVCKNLVKILLPPAWFEVLDDLRSKFTRHGKQWVRLEKFSSMGNGFTFELETIIFAALCCATLRKNGGRGVLCDDVFVFGDDIIVPTVMARNVIPVLQFCGFKLNKEKSFYGDEPFRESCGGDYFNGKPVRPFHLKKEPRNPAAWISLCNGIYRIIETLNGVNGSHWDLTEVHKFATLQIPNRIRSCRGPKALGDIVIWEDDESEWRTSWRGGIRYLRSYLPSEHRLIRYSKFHSDVILACATYGTGNSELGGVIPRDGLLRSDVGEVAFS